MSGFRTVCAGGPVRPRSNRRRKPEMNEAGEAPALNYVLTLDELSTLAREGGKPAETLMNVVALIARRFQTDVCSAYLLEPDRANLVLAATVGLRRECIGTLRMGLHEGLAGLVAEQVRPVAVEEVREASALQVFRRGGRGGLSLVPRRAADRLRRAAGRAGGADHRAPHLSMKRKCGCCARRRRRWRRWSARRARWTASSRRRRNGCGRWRAICGGAGTPMPPACSAIWTRCAGANSRAIPISLLSEIPLEALERRAAERNPAQPHQLRLPPPAGVSEGRPYLGRDARRCAAAASGGLFFGRVRTAPIGADLLGRPRGAGRRSHQERVATWTFRWSASDCSTARAISVSGSTATAGSRKTTSR